MVISLQFGQKYMKYANSDKIIDLVHDKSLFKKT